MVRRELEASKARESALREAARLALDVLDAQVNCLRCGGLLHAPTGPYCADLCGGAGDEAAEEEAAHAIEVSDRTADDRHEAARWALFAALHPTEAPRAGRFFDGRPGAAVERPGHAATHPPEPAR